MIDVENLYNDICNFAHQPRNIRFHKRSNAPHNFFLSFEEYVSLKNYLNQIGCRTISEVNTWGWTFINLKNIRVYASPVVSTSYIKKDPMTDYEFINMDKLP